MKSILLLLLCVGVSYSNDALITTFKTKGFPAKITVSVVDQDDRPVSVAHVTFAYSLYPSGKTTIIQQLSDENGLASAEALTNDGIAIHVQKEDYYKSFNEYKVWKGKDSFKTGRWEPWNPLIKVVLMKTKMPQKRSRKHLRFNNLDPSQKFGFDFLKGILVDPSEASTCFDVVITPSGSIFSVNSRNTEFWDIRSTISFTNSEDGIINKKRNLYSDFRFDYLAPTNGYSSNFEYYIQKTGHSHADENPFPKITDYLILKFSRKTESGELLSYYGIIESWRIGKTWRTGKAYFEIVYRVNTDSGDRNIEYYR